MNNQLNEGTKALIKSNIAHASNLLHGRRLTKDDKAKIQHALDCVIHMVDMADTATHTPTPAELRKTVNMLSRMEADENRRLRRAHLSLATIVLDNLRKSLEDWDEAHKEGEE